MTNPRKGRKFAQVEFVVFLVMVVGNWSVGLKDGWTAEQVWDVIYKSESILTLGPTQGIPLAFTRRLSK